MLLLLDTYRRYAMPSPLRRGARVRAPQARMVRGGAAANTLMAGRSTGSGNVTVHRQRQAWHIRCVLKGNNKVCRLLFHAIYYFI